MNNLNSVIVEGKVSLNNFDIRNSVCHIQIQVSRKYKNIDGEWVEEIISIPAKSFGRLAEIMNQKLELSSKIRIVGRLSKNADTLFILVEHFEIQP